MLKKLINQTKQNAISYGSLPFWSWNDRLEEGELRRQIRNMHDLKMNGFFMHARVGLVTEYMSDEWYHAIDVCIDEAKKLGMQAWSYDEHGFPSGFAGGRMLKDRKNFAIYLTHTVSESFPEDGSPLGVYVIEENRARRVEGPVEGITAYHIITAVEKNTYIDVLDPTVVADFIQCTHEDYKARIAKEDFGTAMPGFFTDEPQYYRYGTPWSLILADRFKERYGYDILDHLVALFETCEGYRTVRFDYHKLITDLYIHSYIKQVYEWCEQNGCQLTGHTIEERALFAQIMCCGSPMRFYQYEHIPGIDWLSRPVKQKSDMIARQIGSVCAQLGKKKALSETFALCGWDATPRELKNILDFQFSGGINLVCQHLYPYSERGERKHDYPLHFSEILPWQRYLADFNAHYNNLGYLLSRGEERASTLIIHPVHNAFMYFNHELQKQQKSVEQQDNDIRALSDRISEHQVAYHYGEEDMMAELAHVEGNTIVIGNCRYDKVILPKVETVDSSTASLLLEYLAGGGRLILEGEKPTMADARPYDFSQLEGNMTFKELFDAQEIIVRNVKGELVNDCRVMVRELDGKRFFFLANIGPTRYADLRITVKNCDNLVRLDISTLTTSPVYGEKQADGSLLVACHLDDSESFILVESDEHAPLPIKELPPIEPSVFLPPKQMQLLERPENTMTLDCVSYSFDGVNFGEEIPLMALRDELLKTRYRGKLYVKQCFTVEKMPRSLRFACEIAPYRSLAVNGHPFTLCNDFWREPCFRTANILPFVRLGKNEIVYELDYYQRDYVYYVLYECTHAETLLTSLTYDTEMAETYLFGDFAVKTDTDLFAPADNNGFAYKGGFTLTEGRDTIDVTNVIKDGLPFFAGMLRLSFKHEWHKGDPTALKLDGRYAICEVYVGGTHAKTLMFDKVCDLSEFLREGENDIVLHLQSSARNLLGPFHWHLGESLSVGPVLFTREKLWKDGKAPGYLNDTYCFVRLGLDTE